MAITNLIPGELFLLLTTRSGRQDGTQMRRQALAGGAITELVLRERVSLGESSRPAVSVISAEPTGEPVLDAALAAVGELDGRKLGKVIQHRSMDLTETIGDALVEAGAVHRKDGLFTTSWPAADRSADKALRARLAAAVQDRSQASLQDGLELSLLRALRLAHRILRPEIEGMSRREIDRAITAIEGDLPVAKELRRVVDSMNAVMVSTMAATAAVGGASAGS